MPDKPNVETLIRVYVKMRDAIEKQEDAHKAALAPLEEQFAVVSNALLAHCAEHNVDSIKSPAGTLTRRVSTRYWPADWDAMRNFIMEHGALELLEQRLHAGNMKDFLETNPNLYPPGLQVESRYKVQVRRATGKQE
ncbi:MAG: hypothetical protein DDT36_00699 [Firmicutes bacterium]|nr:hypothetical protein [Bacillota bacterium]